MTKAIIVLFLIVYSIFFIRQHFFSIILKKSFGGPYITATIVPVRLWTIHPKYLDARGLVALWREGLLAQKVLSGKTKGYRRHPQLIRFQARSNPLAAMGQYLYGVFQEAQRRGYQFDASKIIKKGSRGRIRETHGQMKYEWLHLQRKLKQRAPHLFKIHEKIKMPQAHPGFYLVKGDVQSWEKIF